MSSFRSIDVEKWERKEQFHFFQNYDNPFFGFTTEIDVSKLLKYTRSMRYSFFAACLFASQRQVNLIPEFRYRIKGNELVEYSEISAGSTVLKTNKVFTFCYFDYFDSFQAFHGQVKDRVALCSAASARLDDHDYDPAQVHYSVIPWIHFSALSHPRNYGTDDSIPKIVFGKYSETEGRTLMPVSVEAHHSIMDGYHLGLYFEGLQQSINYPETLLEG
ncbi:MAG: hypothetical protein HQ507_01030 [Candidatus Marinimicrobia bacterium]|nr:hypothetical protein [Candidatus Neomarinimicrobiota bacterium]